MKKFPKIIGLTGKAGSGKDTSLNILKEYLGENLIHLTFAGPLKEGIAKTFFTDPNILMDQDLKKTYCSEPYKGQKITWRQVMQQVGDFYRDNFGSDFFVNIMRRQLDEHFSFNTYICITDVRFDNEAALIKEYGGFIVSIDRDTNVNDTHKSEQPISNNYIDYHVDNNGSIEHLGQQLIMLKHLMVSNV